MCSVERVREREALKRYLDSIEQANEEQLRVPSIPVLCRLR